MEISETVLRVFCSQLDPGEDTAYATCEVNMCQCCLYSAQAKHDSKAKWKSLLLEGYATFWSGVSTDQEK